MNIAVVGMGYVGLANAVLLSAAHNINVFDINQDKLNKIGSRISPIKDKDIQEALNNNNNVFTCNSLKEACENVKFVIIAISANYNTTIDSIDTRSIDKLIADIMEVNSECKIVIKSTVYVGFISDMCKKHKTNQIYFSPEFLREGKAYYDCLNAKRIVIGVNDYSECDDFAKQYLDIMFNLCCTKPATYIVNAGEAEAAKLFANAYLAMRVSFFNELDMFADNLNLDAKNIIDIVSGDERIGGYYNNPSFGFGGYCLPKDTKQLSTDMEKVCSQSVLIHSINKSNKNRWKFIADKIESFSLSVTTKNSPVIGIYKLAMKTGSDNFRDSSILHIIELLKLKGCEILVFEDLLSEENEILGCKICNNIDNFKERCDVVVANRYSDDLFDVKEKLYTRDIFHVE